MNDAQKYIIFVECEMGNMRSYFLLSFQDTKFYEHNKKKKRRFTYHMFLSSIDFGMILV